MRPALLVGTLALALGACSDSSDPGPVDSGVVDCTNDPRVQAYTPGLQVADGAGDRVYVLVESDPAPPIRGTNTWTVRAQDGSGEVLRGLQLDAEASMPDHGHDAPVTPEVTDNGDGTYAVTPLYFFMPGVWRVTLSDADGGAGAGAFWFCVEG